MEEARGLLRSCSGDVDIILAREPDQDQGTAHAQTAAPVERRRRRRLPTIERPKSAPIYNGLVDFRYSQTFWQYHQAWTLMMNFLLLPVM